ncbi:putative orfan [Tupanvirus soda lake]|uniref:Orfan n=2 Tax=Tupanvirus TaxID=2094720 RepID=A0AC62ADI8_9VIRU|nr:putative orfan [Tupanvirus soda lake]QKU35741.1 putative orfan [Tupanvirus soda lake]
MSYLIYSFSSTCANKPVEPTIEVISYNDFYGIKDKNDEEEIKYNFNKSVKYYTKAIYCTLDKKSNDIEYELLVKSNRKTPPEIKLAENRSEFNKIIASYRKLNKAFYITKKINNKCVDMKMDEDKKPIIN